MAISEKDKKILENIAGDTLATKSQRLAGFVITKVAFIVFTVLCAALFDLLGLKGAFAFASAFMIALIIHIVMLASLRQTVGMYVLRLGIEADTIGKFSVARLIAIRILLNWVLPFIPVFGLLSLFNYLNITGNGTNRCIHDELSNSIVVKRAA